VAELTPYVIAYGLPLIFGIVLLEQLGAPIPALPVLIVAGALAVDRDLSAVQILTVAVVASLLADSVWYVLGRLRGQRVLKTLCRISLSPDSCVRQTESLFERWGMPALLIAKFIPGFSTVAPPLAGAMRGRIASFLLYDAGGALLWAGAGVVLDVRTRAGRLRDPRRIKGAAVLDVDNLDAELQALARDQEIILYCT